MTSCFQSSLLRCALVPLSLLAPLAGCDDTELVTTPRDMGTGPIDEGPQIICQGGAATRYRITALHIPTPAEGSAGAIVGHNVDGLGEVCAVPDYTGGVDNSLIELAAALPALAPDDPIDLQAEIDNALNCPADAPASQCSRLDLFVTVAAGTGCVVVNVLDGDDEVLAGPFSGSLDGSGNLRGRVAELALAIPYQTDTGSVDINLAVTNVIVSATQTSDGLENIVLGGGLERSAFEQTIRDLLPLLGSDIAFDDIAPILSNLYDVQVGGQCAALSVGLTGSATAVVIP